MLKQLSRVVAVPVITGLVLTGLISGNVSAADDEAAVYAFPDKFMFRAGAYIVDGSDTQFSVSSDVGGLGTVLDYNRDLGGETRDTIPRIDAYYRFNERHRIDFTSFAIDRKGTRVLAIDPPIVIDGEDFSGGAINSEIKYNLYRLGYGYSFYHSDKAELTLTAGLNITSYEMKFEDDTGAKSESADVTAPLPMFGLRMGYAITPKWTVNYVSEAFFIELDDTIKGAMINYELNTEYKLFKNFAIGAGLARLGTSVEVNDDDWKGKVSDSYRGYTVFGTLYF
ncbi:MAG: DUF481 domain-containing protein [Gammaproteobacteria bacterium]|nr:DUF481 domain-containing protein [Gammaproteobacteria bacterium]NNJ51303.1 DUF481 domain-containing protein [Gammaproteobacteria bacterium]